MGIQVWVMEMLWPKGLRLVVVLRRRSVYTACQGLCPLANMSAMWCRYCVNSHEPWRRGRG